MPITTPPEAAYDCVIYELARADFTITAADRASGFVTGLRVDRNILDDPVRLEIHATVLSAPDGSGSFVQIASNAKANAEGDRLAQACAPAPEASPPHPGAF